MCLFVIMKKYDKPKKGVRKAWKLYEKKEGTLLTINFSMPSGSNHVRVGRWLRSDSGKRKIFDFYGNDTYEPGFHCYKKRPSNSLSIFEYDRVSLVRVEIDEIIAEGTEFGNGVIVCRKLRIPR